MLWMVSVQCSTPKDISNADGIEKLGLMTHQQYLRLEQISIKVESNQKLSDADVGWAVALIKSPAPVANQNARRRAMITLYLSDYKSWTPHELVELHGAIDWLLHDALGQSAGSQGQLLVFGDKIAAITLMRSIRDQFSLNKLAALEKDPNPNVSMVATQAYQDVSGKTLRYEPQVSSSNRQTLYF
jgi:hypothetical protein